ncbi:MAG: trypsin-like serine protease [Deltaproteobacteria bacterium]|nr:trypsin-like serine protease [Deltaproteobacteria bacterium]
MNRFVCFMWLATLIIIDNSATKSAKADDFEDWLNSPPTGQVEAYEYAGEDEDEPEGGLEHGWNPFPAASAGGPPPANVFGIYKRKPVSRSRSFPYRTIGRLSLGCTGTLVGPRHVLTAGHCVYDTEHDRFTRLSELSFSPGQNGDLRPYGTIRAIRSSTSKRYSREHNPGFDYGMVLLERPIGRRTGWMNFTPFLSGKKYGINISGYPGDKPNGSQWHAYCPIERVLSERMYYGCDTFGGNSGSAIYVLGRLSAKSREIIGVHVEGGETQNKGTRMTQAKYNLIRRFIANNP